MSIHRVAVVTLLIASTWACQAATPKPVTILTPAGGEFFVAGTTQRVRLDPKTRNKMVAIDLSTDGGATFPTALGTINNTDRDKTKHNVLSFTVPNTPSGACVIRATADGVQSTSAGFSIATGAAVQNNSNAVQKTGDTMTGTLSLNNTTGAALSFIAPAKQYAFMANANGLRLDEVSSGGTQLCINVDATTSDVRVGSGGSVTGKNDGSLLFNGAMSIEANTFSNNFTANNATCMFFCNTASNNVTITLPAPSSALTGRIYIIKKINAANSVIINPNGGAIDGAAGNVTLAANNAFRFLICAGSTGYFVIGQ